MKRPLCLGAGAASAWLLMALAAPAAHAHEKWVRHDLSKDFDRTIFEQPIAANIVPVLAIGLLAVVLVALAQRYGERCDAMLRGASLLISAFGGQLFAPDLVVSGTAWADVLVGLEAMCAIALLAGLATGATGWAIVGLFVVALLFRPFVAFDGQAVNAWAVLNYLEIAAVGAYVALAGRPRAGLDTRLRPESASLYT